MCHLCSAIITRLTCPSDEIRSVRRFLLRVDETLKSLESEDTDQNGQITIEDTGPKVDKQYNCQ